MLTTPSRSSSDTFIKAIQRTWGHKLQLDDDITDLLLAFKDDPNLLSNIQFSAATVNSAAHAARLESFLRMSSPVMSARLDQLSAQDRQAFAKCLYVEACRRRPFALPPSPITTSSIKPSHIKQQQPRTDQHPGHHHSQQEQQQLMMQQQGHDDVQMSVTASSIAPPAAGTSANFLPSAHLIITMPALSSDASSQGHPEGSSLDGADARQAKRRRGLLQRLMFWLK